MATHHSHYDPENSTTRYAVLPDQPESTSAGRRKSLKVVSGILLSSFFLLSLVLVILNQSSDLSQENSPSSETLTPALSRGASQGVSEKTFRDVFGGSLSYYPWTNTMLTWQRTAYHFQPQKNWMNDPNGPLYHKGWYHLFYQYNPDSAIWGNITWGHAISTDLIHWLYLPFALVPDQWYDINGVWTGSATILPDGQIMMLYTGDTDDYVQVQNLAYPANLSDPLLIDWVKYRGNPVMVPPPGIGVKDFRDPTTAWTGPQNGQWLLTIGSKIGKTGIALVYDTSNFTNFKLLDGVLHAVPGTGMWECVDFYPVSTVETNGLDTSYNGPGIKHVLKASLDDDKHDYYAIGTYDPVKNKWTPDNPELDVGIGLRLDYGKYYASKTFYDPKEQRRILWGWIGETDSEAADLLKGWASVQSIPRTVLYDKETRTHVLQWPVKEIESLRVDDPLVKQVNLQPGSIELVHVDSAAQLDVQASFQVDKAALEGTIEADVGFNCSNSGGAAKRGILGPFGVVVIADQTLSELTPVYFYIAKGTDGRAETYFCADETRSSEAPGVAKQVYGSSVPVLDGEKHSMRLLVDHSIVESFAQGGRTVITSRIYPTKAINGAARLFVFNNATGASVTASLKIWSLKSADIRSFPLDQL
ncbi:PREDICTED: acid beta-fructofuranosidase AIV-18-like [Nicotiana attenuata]|uniref:beta-fructofuranosidase n=1 Tax=Nicotiana attenuata TaxID=49451 RepID=A0A1J6L3E7_NICAT|nr:PREDICTED: acid beta-fructofuranosidase AIV-18-like [Nicotiana attenuata]OIT28255.1 acid beta-fructofuranosidase aiv-18 [Nicotiana attenuata]